MSDRERNGNKKTAVAWYMFPCSSGFVLVVFSWECGSIDGNLKNNYMPTIFLTVFAVLIVNLLPIFALAVLDHQFVF